jgi:hypothetical protein
LKSKCARKVETGGPNEVAEGLLSFTRRAHYIKHPLNSFFHRHRHFLVDNLFILWADFLLNSSARATAFSLACNASRRAAASRSTISASSLSDLREEEFFVLHDPQTSTMKYAAIE